MVIAKRTNSAFIGTDLEARLRARPCEHWLALLSDAGVPAGPVNDLAAVQAYMAECKVAKQYWPERVEVVPAVPRTPSGKIQKFILRERAKAFGA